jgi:hypothetical protein
VALLNPTNLIIIREHRGELIFNYPGYPCIRVNRRRHVAPRELTKLIIRILSEALARPTATLNSWRRKRTSRSTDDSSWNRKKPNFLRNLG